MQLRLPIPSTRVCTAVALLFCAAGTAQARDVGTHIGKVLRINPDGGAAEGNPAIEGYPLQ